TPCVGDPCLNEETCTVNGSSHLCSCLPKYTEISLEENGNCGIDNDCADNTTCPSGIYKLHLTNISEVYCDMDIDYGGWIVFQRRVNGKVNFYRDWNCYKYGFGNLNSEFWLGNELIHEITKDGNYMLRIDLEDLEGETRTALYSNFILEDANSEYTLRVSGYSGNAGDSLAEHNDKQFSTKDRNNIDCAIEFQGAWWYNGCHHSNLNGQYLNGTHSTYADGINWFDWRGYYYSLKKTSMMIRRK
ncbi:ficolin, partial [Mytilus galloprovincialis]